MDLRLALGLTGAETIAFTGAGGKTSAMATLARELLPPVVMTTTTHLGKWQGGIAQQHIIITSPGALKKSDFLGSETILVTGPPGKDERWGSLNPESLEKLSRICRENEIPLLIEADGARQRPLKAPAGYEPAIPPWVDRVVVMAGLGGLKTIECGYGSQARVVFTDNRLEDGGRNQSRACGTSVALNFRGLERDTRWGAPSSVLEPGRGFGL